MSASLVDEVADGSSNVREVWKLSYKQRNSSSQDDENLKQQGLQKLDWKCIRNDLTFHQKKNEAKGKWLSRTRNCTI
ncbi:hypothetical protein RJ641_015088 [Dillenia turbinata]|uniref:Uncharacterized protein n=1 Tax=Dillenia turbinata TaxID=194707 RepID=A0AAN8UTC2_9MAGN